MGQNTVQSYGSKGRQDLLQFDPEDITLINDKNHPLYDPRINLPVDESLVRNIMVHGIIEPIAVRKNGERNGQAVIECVVGRQRVKAAIEANKRLVAEGKQPIRVPATIKRGEDATLFGILISENEIRQNDGPLERAKKIQRFLDMGRSEEDASIVFGFTKQTVKAHLALLDCDKSVQHAVEEGRIGATLAAQEFSKIPREEQRTALEKLLENGTAKGVEAKEAVRRIRNGESEPKKKERRVRGRKEIVNALKTLGKVQHRDAEVACAVLKYVLGAENSFASYAKIEQALFPEEEEE